MRNRFFAAAVLCVLVLNLAGSSFAEIKGKNVQTNQLVSLLPVSDGVVTLDVKRFFGTALPTILSANQPMLDRILSKINEIKTKTGIDIRQFEYVAAGVTAKQITAKKYELDPVIIARGQINAAALLVAAKLAANGKYREEKIGDKTIYVFAAKEIAARNKPQVAGAKRSSMIDKMFGRLSQETAVTALDANTIVFGALPLVRQTIGARTPISAELTNLLNKNEVSVVSFAAKMPVGMSAFLPLDNDELGKNVDSIRYVFGNVNVAGENTSVHMTARTLQNAQAQGLFETLEGLQILGKAFLGGSRSVDKQVYARLIENARFSVNANDVMLDLQVPQRDIDVLIGILK